jgi:phospholipid-binding lipoprotein MlaA
VIEVVDKRADILGAEHLMVGDDRYHFIRSAYFQNRQFRINDGVVDDPFADESFEDYEDF